MRAAAVIVCAGEGRRLGRPKADFLLKGNPLFYYSLQVFLAIDSIEQVVLVLQEKHFDFSRKFINSEKVSLAPGASSRSCSVANGLSKVKKGLDYVLIHDCARPFVTKKITLNIIKNLEKYSAVICGLPTADTLKKVESGLAKNTLKREDIFSIQTPQGFKKDLLEKAYKNKQVAESTDSAQLIEKMGHKVKVIEGSRLNFKITYPEDIYLAGKIVDGYEWF